MPPNARIRDAAQVVRLAQADAFANIMAPVIRELQGKNDLPLNKIAYALNKRDIKARRGGIWTSKQVSRLLDRIKGLR